MGFVVWVLGAEPFVPEGEVESVVVAVFAVMDGVVGGAYEPTAQPVVGEGGGEPIDAQMVEHGPDGHGGHDGDQGDEVERHQKDESDQEGRLDDRFEWVEGEGCPGGGLARSVVALVQPAK